MYFKYSAALEHSRETPQHLKQIPGPKSFNSKKDRNNKRQVHFNSKRKPVQNPIVQAQNTNTYDRYKKDQKTWALIQRVRQSNKYDDPLTYANERLSSFFDTYDVILRRTTEKKKPKRHGIDLPLIKQAHDEVELNELIDLIGHWSLSALKMISGVEGFLTNKVLLEHFNYEHSGKERMRVFNIQEEFFGQQWSWELAADIPDSDIYDFTFKKELESNFPHVGPTNISAVHVDTLEFIPYPDDYFSLSICYDLWLQLKSNDWVPALKEIRRILKPNCYIHLFLYDFDILNCSNPEYSNFFKRVHRILQKLGIDPWPSKHIHQRLRDAGFQNISYSFISLRKGINTNMGHLLDFVQSYLELIIFDKISNFHMDENDLKEFRDVKKFYHDAVKSGEMVTDFGSGYCMSVFAKKV
ncbi:hypothetical protein WICPIJ_002503 [Wickerhamomyces pijperi]|uniref:Methyltransferase type 11 domain-containing protein n=1 Tax=Wickerhamomyces pijperi TaxID=599730 RepID=A0A9P8TPR9_WICPI|nr:hypothetical protein WICPIJ_002503 [Wickerhamomyces pijperi]